MADRLPPDLHLFRTYKSPQETLGINDFENPELPSPTSCHASDQLVWKAARASGAAPSFFRPEGNFVDGGIISNNPSLDLLTEIAEYNVAKRAIGQDDEVIKPTILVSLGTGVPPLKKVIHVS
jgi:calcium-independent phospholipase A2